MRTEIVLSGKIIGHSVLRFEDSTAGILQVSVVDYDKYGKEAKKEELGTIHKEDVKRFARSL